MCIVIGSLHDGERHAVRPVLREQAVPLVVPDRGDWPPTIAS